MSLFCLCVVNTLGKTDNAFLYAEQIKLLATQYGCNVGFCVDWPEPIASCFQDESLVINIMDVGESDNCEWFLLPDNCYINGKKNVLSFRERMRLLQDICNIFDDNNYKVDLYLGQSGTLPSEFLEISLASESLIDYLATIVEPYGIDGGVHISVIK